MEEIVVEPNKLFERRKRLSQAKQALLDEWLIGEQTSKRAIIPRRSALGSIPLSFAQERLWFVDQLIPSNYAYNIPLAYRFTGQLDVATLERSLNEVIGRHDSLRTIFSITDGKPTQVVLPSLTVALPIIDLKELIHKNAEALRLVKEEAQRSFDLTRSPLVRTTLLWLGTDEYILLITMHHIISDGWSMGIFFREAVAVYEALSAGACPSLPGLAIQYADFADWQREWLQGPVLDEQIAYWRRQLEGAPASLDLSTRARPAIQTFKGARQLFELSPELSRAIKTLSLQEGVSLFMTLLAAFKVLLYRYTEQPDIVVGTTIAGRNRLQLENVIGCFVNTLVLRTDLAGNPTFRELLRRVQETTTGAYAHQDMPFERLVEELQPERDTSRNPLFQVMFVLQNAPMPALRHPHLSCTPINVEWERALFDLRLEVWDFGALGGTLEYATALFDDAAITRMLHQFEMLLEAIVKDPEQRVLDLPLLSDVERRQLVWQWNQTRAGFSSDLTIHQLVEMQVNRTPDAIAVEYEDERLSYSEMNRRADHLARQLRALGLKRGDWVALYMNRSTEMIVALLAVLKAGGAYVPLENTFPAARIEWILSTLNVPVVITSSPHLEMVIGLQGRLRALKHVLCLDEIGQVASKEETKGLQQIGSDDIAYIIFTSGSTGTPKGVIVPHRPVINLIQWVNRSFGVGVGDRLLFITSLCFDLSVYDVFGILAAGGTIRVASETEVHEPEQLVTILHNEVITFWDSAPAALQQLVSYFGWERKEKKSLQLRLVFLSGDWIPVTLPDVVREVFPDAKVISLGGATEATVWSNCYSISKVESNWVSIPYGKPIQNARYYVLDRPLHPVPIGVPGDLYIAGDCLSYGYDDPVLTAGKFIPDPFSDEIGSRMYRTGDRARFLSDGNLEFLGRSDLQVKVRGFRIELGEIEACLLAHRCVQAAVVQVREDRPGDRRLVAYLVAKGPEVPSAVELRRFLQAQIPGYMVPSQLVWLSALPITTNGKLDRKALPAPRDVAPEQAGALVPPRSPTERLLADIWAEVLGLKQVGVFSNFFELGGDSIHCVQIVARAKQTGLRLSAQQMFQHQTIADLADALSAASTDTAGRAPVVEATELSAERQDWSLTDLKSRKLEHLLADMTDVADMYPLTPMQDEFLYHRLHTPESGLHVVHHAHLLRGVRLDTTAFERAWQHVINRQKSLRISFLWEGLNEPVQVEHEQAIIGLELENWQGLDPAAHEKRLKDYIRELRCNGFDLKKTPHTRLAIFQLARDVYYFVHGFDFMLQDGWSFPILMTEVLTSYQAFAAGREAKLGPVYSNREFVTWLRHQGLSGAEVFWRRTLGGIDLPRPALVNRTHDIVPQEQHPYQYQMLPLTREMEVKLSKLAKEHHLTIYTFVQGAWALLLNAYTGDQDLVFGSTFNGRDCDLPEIEHRVGLFLNIVPLRVQVPYNAVLLSWLDELQTQAVGVRCYQHTPLSKIHEWCGIPRDRPLFESYMVFEAFPIDAGFGQTMAALGNVLDVDLLAQTEHALRVELMPRPTLTLRICYYGRHFTAKQINAMLRNLKTLLDAFLSNPRARLGELAHLVKPE